MTNARIPFNAFAIRIFSRDATSSLARKNVIIRSTLFLIILATAWLCFRSTFISSERLAIGDPCGAFMVQKVAGAENDGVSLGDTLCYRCKYQTRPMILLFSRSTDKPVGALARNIDQALVRYQDHQLRAIFSLLGDKVEALNDAGVHFCREYDLKLIPVVIPRESVTGPRNYKLAPNAEISVILVKAGRVYATFEFDSKNIDPTELLESVEKMLH